MRPIMREYVAEALEGAIIQAEWCVRFLENGNDSQAEAAFRRMMEFIRRGSNELKAIKVHSEHGRATVARVHDEEVSFQVGKEPLKAEATV